MAMSLVSLRVRRLLVCVSAGWAVQDVTAVDSHASRGVAIRAFPLASEYGFADYLLYVDGRAAGVIEAKKAGATLTGVEAQSGKYAQGLPASLPAWRRPLPFVYEFTGAETHFTNGLDPEPRARNVFAFHLPETLAHWLSVTLAEAGVQTPTAQQVRAAYELGTFLARVRSMPELVTEWSDFKLWPAQITAIRNLEAERAGPPRPAPGFRRSSLSQAAKVNQYVSPVNNCKFGEEYIVQHIACNLGIKADDFGYVPFNQRGGLGKVQQLLGADLPGVLASLNEALAA